MVNLTECEVMAHRYLYYVLGTPVITDFMYDQLERTARQVLPPSSCVHSVGSSLASSYTIHHIQMAEEFLKGATN